MRRALAGAAAVLAAGALSPAAARAASTTTAATTAPTAAQIRAAVARAQRSSYLWATVNVCLPTAHGGGLIGVRGEMPALGFRTTLAMTIQLRRYVSARHAYVALTAATARRTVTVGPEVVGVHQDGVEFPFGAAAGNLDATVTFTWTRAGRRLGQVIRTTTGGHPAAAFSRPAHHSSANCRL